MDGDQSGSLDQELMPLSITVPANIAIGGDGTGEIGAGEGEVSVTCRELESPNDHLKPEVEDSNEAISDESGFILFETARGNMLFAVNGDLGDVYYNGGVAASDLEGRQILNTELLSQGVIDTQGSAVYVAQPVSSIEAEMDPNTTVSMDSVTLETVSPNSSTVLAQSPLQQVTTLPTVMTTNNHLATIANDMQGHVQGEGQIDKKRRGGWPKGRKRKTTPEIQPPRPPATGYVLYAIERRQQIKETNPEIHFAEVTKILGQEWTKMQPEKKQKYLDEANRDKKRYVEDLKAFQQSEAYQNVLKKKKNKVKGHNEHSWDPDENYATTTASDIEDDSMGDLYCKICDQYFSSLHNKKEHMLGRQHYLNVSGEVNKELKVSQLSPLESAEFIDSNDQSGSEGGPLDITGFINNFLQDNLEREIELKSLRQTLRHLHQQNENLFKDFSALKQIENHWKEEIDNEKDITVTLSRQIEGLKNVSNLFKVINFQV